MTTPNDRSTSLWWEAGPVSPDAKPIHPDYQVMPTWCEPIAESTQITVNHMVSGTWEASCFVGDAVGGVLVCKADTRRGAVEKLLNALDETDDVA